MKILKRLLLVLMLGIATSLPAQRLTMPFLPILGHWWLGMLEEANLPINLTFGVDQGELKPFLYSPMQSAEPMPATKWSFDNDTLRINHKPTGVRLVLVWNSADSSFSGTFRQGMLRAQMHFAPTDTIFSILRPQTPKPPFPYSEREVTIIRKKAGVTLTGTLTIPEGKGPFPAVVLVSGSGQQNRDEELLGHKPFLVLADYLSRHGIAVLRYDDRGVGGSKGEVAKATTFDFADDAEAVLKYLCKQKQIDSKRVGIIGHSEGGMIAPIVASHNSKVAFIVLLAGPGSTGADILLQQNERLCQLQGAPQELIDLRLGFMRSVFALSDTISNYSATVLKLFEEKTQGLTAEQRKQVGLTKGETMMLVSQMESPWMRTFVKLNSADYLRRTHCPILAVNGDRDCQVLPINLRAIADATEAPVTTLLMPGLNHLMQQCNTGAPSEYMLIEETFAPVALEAVAEWILRIAK